MFRFLTGWSPSCRKRLAELEDAFETLDARYDRLSTEMSERDETIQHQLRRVYQRITKRAKDSDDEFVASPPDGGEAEPRFVRGQVPPSAHLARRFRLGG